jgi:hypothetical protein
VQSRLEVPPLDKDRFLDEIDRILNQVWVPGPSTSLIQEDLKSAETSLGPDYERKKQAGIERFATAREAFLTVSGEQDEQAFKTVLRNYMEYAKQMFVVALDPSRSLREAIIRKLNHGESTPEPYSGNGLRKEGEVWHVSFNSISKTFKHSKGIFYIQQLLHNPGIVFTGIQLVELCQRSESGRPIVDIESMTDHLDPRQVRDLDIRQAPDSRWTGDKETIADDIAKTRYKTTLKAIDEEMEEATSLDDQVEIGRLQERRAKIVNDWKKEFSPRGQSRSMPNREKKDYDSARKAIKTALEKISEVFPELKKHFDFHIRIDGTFSYQMDSDEHWAL